ncbi:MAG TPA: ABC transporter permease, partial [Kofleriaceae bacterium]|nr:ABC transporter permease [Kofleriaceae bacterium]
RRCVTDLVHRGELVARARLRRRGWLLTGPALAWLTLFLVVPALAIVPLSFAARGPHGEVEWRFAADGWRRLAGFGVFGWSANTLRILARSVGIAALSTVLTLLFAYPLAFFIAARGRRGRALCLAALTIPFCTNLVVRMFAWRLVFSKDMWPARLATWMGLIPHDMPLYPGAFAVQVGMVTALLPFAALPLYAAVERLDWTLVEAAVDLHASRLRVFRHAILPQTAAGLRAAVVLSFIPALGMFVVSDQLGGADTMLVGNLIQQQFFISRDWPYAAALSLALIALSLAGLWAMRGALRDGEAA